MFFWQFPSPGTPLFLLDEGPVAVLLKQARGGGMVLAGEQVQLLLPLRQQSDCIRCGWRAEWLRLLAMCSPC